MRTVKVSCSSLKEQLEQQAYAYGVSPAVSTLLGEYLIQLLKPTSMQTQTQDKKNNWHTELTSRINSLSEQFELDEMQTSTLRDFITTLSKEQYRNGSKSGAGWAFEQARKKVAAGQAV